MKPRIYLDHAATTPIRPEAKAAMMEAMERWANPSSPHAEGRAARAALEDARARIRAALGWNGEVIFTSGASEAIWIAMNRTKLSRRIVYATEHDAVFRAAPDAEVMTPVADDFEPVELIERLQAGLPAVVAIQDINPETGDYMMLGSSKSPPVYDAVREAGGILVRDFAQAYVTENMDRAWGDFVVMSSHKIGGPTGVGALLARDLSLIDATGGQERGYRAGTENLPAIMGFAAAIEASVKSAAQNTLERFAPWLDFSDFLYEQNAWPEGGLASTNGHSAKIYPITMPRLSAAAQLIRFDQMGFSVSAGSACSSGSMKPSRVLKAFGVPDDVAARTIRVSFGWTTTAEEIEAFKNAWLELAEEARARA